MKIEILRFIRKVCKRVVSTLDQRLLGDDVKQIIDQTWIKSERAKKYKEYGWIIK